MCRLLNSQNTEASGRPVEYLNTLLGSNVKNFYFQINDWAVPDIQNEFQKATHKEGYYYYKLTICKKATCNDLIQKEIENFYFGVQTIFSETTLKGFIGKIVSFDCLETNIHKLKMITEDISVKNFKQCDFV